MVRRAAGRTEGDSPHSAELCSGGSVAQYYDPPLPGVHSWYTKSQNCNPDQSDPSPCPSFAYATERTGCPTVRYSPRKPLPRAPALPDPE